MMRVKKCLYLIVILLFILCGCENKPNEQPDEPKKEAYLKVHYIVGKDDDELVDVIKTSEELASYELKTVTKTGHVFMGWYEDDEFDTRININDFDLPTGEVDINVYAYAKLSKEKYWVSFYSDGELVSKQSVEYGSSAVAPIVNAKKGYSFVNWNKDFTNISGDLEVQAVYEYTGETKNVIVVLGNWMNNDGTISSTMRKRLELALRAVDELGAVKIVVTGGMANSVAGISEAQAMYNYLTSHGISGDMIIKEDQSMSTYQNANYTMKKVEDLDFDNMVIVSTIEHFINYQTLKYFDDAIMNNEKVKAKGINLMIYTNVGSY